MKRYTLGWSGMEENSSGEWVRADEALTYSANQMNKALSRIAELDKKIAAMARVIKEVDEN